MGIYIEYSKSIHSNYINFEIDIDTCSTKPVMHNGVTLYFRGIRITKALLDDLAIKGLMNATDVILTGGSGMLGRVVMLSKSLSQGMGSLRACIGSITMLLSVWLSILLKH